MFEQNKNVPGFNGFQYMVHDAISKADIDIKKDLYSNIFATGGNTVFPDFTEKFNRVLNTLAPNNVKVKVLSHPTSLEKIIRMDRRFNFEFIRDISSNLVF